MANLMSNTKQHFHVSVEFLSPMSIKGQRAIIMFSSLNKYKEVLKDGFGTYKSRKATYRTLEAATLENW